MVTLNRTSSGLLYRSDGSLTGWSGAGQWTSAAVTRFVASPSVPMQPGAIGNQSKGEPKWEAIGNTWYLSYDDKITGGKSLPAMQTSTDRGVTWVDIGLVSFSPALTTSFAITQFFLDPVSSNWYAHGLSGSGVSTGGGLNTPYQQYIYKSTTGIMGPYSLVNTIGPNSGSWCDRDSASGSCYYDGTNYILYSGGFQPVSSDVSPWTGLDVNVIGIWKATTLAGTFSQPTPSTPLIDVTTMGAVQSNTFGIENAIFGYNSVLNLYVIMGNADIMVAGNGYSWSTMLQTSATPTGFSTADWKTVQWVNPADVLTILDVTSILHNGSNSQAATGPNGEMAAVCSGQWAPGGFSPNYSNLRPSMSVLEPATNVIRYTGSSDTTYRQLSRPLTHGDITVELACELTAINSGPGSGEFHVTYRSDGTLANEYRAILQTNNQCRLDKFSGGTRTLLTNGTGSQSFANNGATSGFLHRVKVQVIGNVHKMWLDGELQYTYTDSSSPLISGTYITLGAIAINADAINVSCRTSDTITVNGMQPNTSCWLRAACGIPIAPIVANSSGVGTVSYQHFPLYSLDIGGTDYTVGADSRIWGGDVLQFSGLSTLAPAQAGISYYS